MKKIIVTIVLALLFGGTSFVSANELKPRKSYVSINQELTTLLNPKSEVGVLENDVIIRVKVTINANNEIVVLKTNSNNLELNNYINEKLNYKKLSTNELEMYGMYEFEINFKS